MFQKEVADRILANTSEKQYGRLSILCSWKMNIKKFDVAVGMYHDQVLTPMKTLYNFNAINLTLGLPFFRVSPDHVPNNEMIGKNISDPKSLFSSINFFKKLNEN